MFHNIIDALEVECVVSYKTGRKHIYLGNIPNIYFWFFMREVLLQGFYQEVEEMCINYSQESNVSQNIFRRKLEKGKENMKRFNYRFTN